MYYKYGSHCLFPVPESFCCPLLGMPNDDIESHPLRIQEQKPIKWPCYARPMLCSPNPDQTNTMDMVRALVPVILRARGSHMITTITNTAA